MKLKFIPIILSAAMLSACASDIENIPETETSAVTEESKMTETSMEKPSECTEFTVPAEDKYVRILGRTTYDGDVLYTDYSLSGIEFEFEGTSCSIDITSDGERFGDERKAYAAVYYDDSDLPAYRFRLADGTYSYKVFESDIPKNVKIRIEKLSEAPFADMGIKSIHTVSYFAPSPTGEKPYKIQFVGDSITCAYGIEGEDENSPFMTAEENPHIGYAYLTAKHFGADYELISQSGIGVVSCYTDIPGVKEDYVLMPDLYPYEDRNFDNAHNREPVKYVRKNKYPDIVVINLGTNDYSYTADIGKYTDEFGEGYYKLLEAVHEQNPDAAVICTLGTLGNGLMPEIENQAERYRRNISENIYTLEFPLHDTEKDGSGARFHPSAETQKKDAELLIAFIEKEGILDAEDIT